MVINLVATDYDANTGNWDNRATPGGFDGFNNGDFFRDSAPALPSKGTSNGVTYVAFNGNEGNPQRLQTSNGASMIAGASIWGALPMFIP